MTYLLIDWFIVYSTYYLIMRIFYDKELSKLYSILSNAKKEYKDIDRRIKILQKAEKENADAINLLRIQDEASIVKFKVEAEKFILIDCMMPYPKIFLLVFMMVIIFYFPYIRLEMAFHKSVK